MRGIWWAKSEEKIVTVQDAKLLIIIAVAGTLACEPVDSAEAGQALALVCAGRVDAARVAVTVVAVGIAALRALVQI